VQRLKRARALSARCALVLDVGQGDERGGSDYLQSAPSEGVVERYEDEVGAGKRREGTRARVWVSLGLQPQQVQAQLVPRRRSSWGAGMSTSPGLGSRL
jgi:hypothetical protein